MASCGELVVQLDIYAKTRRATTASVRASIAFLLVTQGKNRRAPTLSGESPVRYEGFVRQVLTAAQHYRSMDNSGTLASSTSMIQALRVPVVRLCNFHHLQQDHYPLAIHRAGLIHTHNPYAHRR